jgi:excisionase family DNA binding protein
MDKLLTPQEIAELLGVRPSTVYQWTHQGFIPHTKLGRFVRFKESDVMKWVDERSTPGRKTRKVDLRGLELGRLKGLSRVG